MAEIKIERKRRHLLPWILALALLALVLIGVVAAANRESEASPDRGTATTWHDDTPPRLRQYAWVLGAPAGVPGSAREAA